MAHPTQAEAAEMGRADSGEAIEAARLGGTYPVVTIADGADHHAQTTGFHKRWWRQHDEDWPEAAQDAYNEAFTRELMAAKVAVVELQFDAAGGKKWTNVGVVDLEQWEPNFPFDPASTGWVRQDPRSRVGWRRRSMLRKLFGKKKTDEDAPA